MDSYSGIAAQINTHSHHRLGIVEILGLFFYTLHMLRRSSATPGAPPLSPPFARLRSASPPLSVARRLRVGGGSPRGGPPFGALLRYRARAPRVRAAVLSSRSSCLAPAFPPRSPESLKDKPQKRTLSQIQARSLLWGHALGSSVAKINKIFIILDRASETPTKPLLWGLSFGSAMSEFLHPPAAA